MTDGAKSERVREFVTQLTHTQGKWAGEPFKLLDWQWDGIIRPLFGTVTEDGLRQYRICYVEVPKKNGKSELAAAIALYMLCADGEASPEVYLAAADKFQAGRLYHTMDAMIQKNEVLEKVLDVRKSVKRINNPRNMGFCQVLSADVKTKHGINPSCIIFDELHAQPNDELWRVLTSGTHYARAQQLIFVMSTAGIHDINSIWWRVREKARQIRDGIIIDKSFFPVLYIADPEKDNPEDEELWKRVNPSLDRIFTLDTIRADFETAKADPVEYQDFLRYRLNIPIKSLRRWMPMDKWDQCATPVDMEALKGRVCYGGLDLSTKIDLSVFILLFPPQFDGEKWEIAPFFYCPEEAILTRSRRDAVPYDIWARDGYITATPGNVVDYDFIRRDIVRIAADYSLQEIGFDPYNATEIATKLLNDEGIQMVEVRQGAKTLSEPAKDVLAKVMQGRIAHGGHPVMRWCADNLVMVPDANENIRPAKDKATDRIDGMTALFNAWSRAFIHVDTGVPEISFI